MIRFFPMVLLAALSFSLVLGPWTSMPLAAAEPSESFAIWPDAAAAPGRSQASGDERRVDDRRRPFYQITNVSVPAIEVFPAPADKRTGAAVLVLPGGGLQRLAYEHEGLEIADWLNPQGLTVFVLKYRVPAPAQTGLMDAQRAMGLIRSRAAEFQIDPERISVMGFSAGGEIALLLATNHQERAYPPIDAADALSCRPENVCLVYPGGIASPRAGALRQDIAARLDSESTPPMFLVHAFADTSINSLALATALKQAGVPCELHLYQEGGHGFGARDSGLPLSSWKERYLAWIAADGFLDKPYVAEYARQFVAAARENGAPPRLTAAHPDATLADGYAVQRRVVAEHLRTDAVAGYKGGPIGAEGQAAAGIDGPLNAVLFRSGRVDVDDSGSAVLEVADYPESIIETELGFIVSQGVDISTRLNTIEHVKGAIEALVPVIELPIRFADRMEGTATAADNAAINLGSSRFIVGAQRISPDALDADGIQIRLTRDGSVLHETSTGTANNGQWASLMHLINGAVDQGYTLRSGDVIICGSLGQVHPTEPGQYVADFSELGTIRFELK